MPRCLWILITFALMLSGCAGKTEPDAPAKTASTVGKSRGPKTWKPKPGSEEKITIYVKGMSDRLGLT